jgi:5-methylcytosine-specific restriction enzyme subunit McrC
MFRDYVAAEDNLPYVRGKINVPGTLRRNPFARHLHYQRFDEFIIDNPLNRLLKATMNMLIKIAVHPDNKTALRDALVELQDVKDEKISESLFSRTVITRRNADYIPLINLAKLFARHTTTGLQPGKVQTYSVLIPLNDLFEAYVATRLKHFNSPGRKYRRHTRNTGKLISDGNEEFCGVKPDITLAIEGGIAGILDAKYKRCVDDNEKYIFRQSDIYQFIAYAGFLDCKYIFAIYPKFKGCPVDSLALGSYTVNLHSQKLTFIPMHIDLDDDTEFEQIHNKIISLCDR